MKGYRTGAWSWVRLSASLENCVWRGEPVPCTPPTPGCLGRRTWEVLGPGSMKNLYF